MPNYYSRNKQQTRSPFIGVTLGYSDLYNTTPILKDIIDRLQQYSLSQIMDVIGRISSVLNHFGHKQHDKAQDDISRIIFGKQFSEFQNRVRKWIDSRRNNKTAPFYSLFHELQLLNLAKIALLSLPSLEKTHNDSMALLGEALLMVTDIINQEASNALQNKDINTPEGQKRWHQFFLTNGLFNVSDNPAHSLPRAYDIYLTDKPHLKKFDVYINLPKLVKKITGIEPDMIWTIFFSFMSHWYSIKNDDAATAPGPLELTTFFTKACNFSEEDSKLFFSFVSSNHNLYHEKLLIQGCSLQSIQPYNLLPFEDKPLIEINNNVYCTSVKLLLQKITRGFHYLFLNGINSKTERNRYLIYMGYVFSDYIHRTLMRAYPPSSGRYISGNDLESLADSKMEVCDGAIIYPDAIILIEIKASLLPIQVRTSADWEKYTQKTESIFIKAASQIQATINQINLGTYESIGLRHNANTQYFPIIITLENLPMNNILYDKIYSDLSDRSLLKNHNIRPIQVMDVGDCEFLEPAITNGYSIYDLLKEKISDDSLRGESFGNFCLRKNKPFARSLNNHLLSQFDALAKMAENIIRSAEMKE